MAKYNIGDRIKYKNVFGYYNYGTIEGVSHLYCLVNVYSSADNNVRTPFKVSVLKKFIESEDK